MGDVVPVKKGGPHRYQAGNPGRPPGTRVKLKEVFLKLLTEDFRQHGADAITRLREEDPVNYVKIIASLMPKQIIDEHENVVTPPVLVLRAWETPKDIDHEDQE